MKTKIFCDSADFKTIKKLSKNSIVKGFTTNPSLMRLSGARDYKTYSLKLLAISNKKPISFEVFADEFDEMERQALKIRSWGENVYVKIPVSNTRHEMSYGLIERLSGAGVHLNITAILSLEQVRAVATAVRNGPASVISVFAGRIADTGLDPVPLMRQALKILEVTPQAELLWASPREVLNIYQADAIGCHIITATNDIIRKLPLFGKDLAEYSLETVQMFYDDAERAGYTL